VAEIRALYQGVVKNRAAGWMICDRYESNSGKTVIPGRGAVSYRVSIWRYDKFLWLNVSQDPEPKCWMAQLDYSSGTDAGMSFEFLFDDKDNVVFFYQSLPKSSEQRYYFSAGKVIRVIDGKGAPGSPAAHHLDYAEQFIMGAARGIRGLRMPDIYMR